MSDSLQLTLLETLRQQVGQIPGVQACYLDRYEPVGENEPKPVVIINSVGSQYTKQSSHTVRIETITIEVEVHVSQSTTVSLSRQHDPWFSLIDTAIDTAARGILGYQGIDLERSDLRGESGWLGFLLLTYTAQQIHSQGNRSAVPGIA